MFGCTFKRLLSSQFITWFYYSFILLNSGWWNIKKKTRTKNYIYFCEHFIITYLELIFVEDKIVQEIKCKVQKRKHFSFYNSTTSIHNFFASRHLTVIWVWLLPSNNIYFQIKFREVLHLPSNCFCEML